MAASAPSAPYPAADLSDREEAMLAMATTAPSSSPGANGTCSSTPSVWCCASWVYLSLVRLMLKRLAHEQVQPAFQYRQVSPGGMSPHGKPSRTACSRCNARARATACVRFCAPSLLKTL